MILMGDEVRRTQHGNNNAYCHDNEVGWFDWDLVAKHVDVHRFVETPHRATAPARLRARAGSPDPIDLIREASKGWHGTKLNEPDWSDHSHSVAFSAELQQENRLVHLIFNAYWEPLQFQLPTVG